LISDLGRRRRPPPAKKAASVSEVAGHFVLQSQLLFFEAVEKVFVGVGSMLFFLDQGMKSGMLRLEFLGHSLVHWCLSFLTKPVSPERNKSRIVDFVLSLVERLIGPAAQLAANGRME
jgi:hypothetical protein